jgi:hypothetical protein
LLYRLAWSLRQDEEFLVKARSHCLLIHPQGRLKTAVSAHLGCKLVVQARGDDHLPVSLRLIREGMDGSHQHLRRRFAIG